MADTSTDEKLWQSLFQTLGRAAFTVEADKLSPLSPLLPSGIQNTFHDFEIASIEAHHPFLAAFLQETSDFQESGQGAGPTSGPWEETGHDEKLYYFDAQIFRFEEAAHLVIDDLGNRYLQQKAFMQKGRENLLLNEKLNRQIQLKEIFYHCMTHDIRGPLSEIQLASDLLFQSGNWTEKQLNMRDIIQGAVQYEYQLIDNMLHAFKEEGIHQVNTKPTAVNLHTLAHSATEALKGQASASAVTFSIPQKSGAIPAVQLEDPVAISRVFYNLLSNALRHSPRNGIVSIHFELQGSFIQVSITDDGPGIPLGQEKHIFEKFTQSSESKSGKVGLGLYYSQLVIRRHGGMIEASNSTISSGACFKFTFPLH